MRPGRGSRSRCVRPDGTGEEEEGLWKGREQGRRNFGTFCRERPDELWQIDHVHPDDGMVLLSVTDDHSRKALALEVRCTATADDITEILDAVTERYGCPREILSDHQSKVERWHRSLRSSAEEYSNAVGEYAVFYDTVRPHWSRGNRVPDAMYYGNG
jgi:transposase InsO family protein